MIKTNTDSHDFVTCADGTITSLPVMPVLSKRKHTTEYEESQEFQESPTSPEVKTATQHDTNMMKAMRISRILDSEGE